MSTVALQEDLRVDRSVLEEAGFDPYYRTLPGLQNNRPWIDRQPFLDLASNDYLGLASDPRVIEPMCAALRQFGASMCGTPIATGYASLFRDLEQALARFIGLEDAVVFPSCYQANTSLFAALARPTDAILVDHYAHASLVHGIRAVGCKVKPFLHNDPEHLEKQLAASQSFPRVFVVTETVFSTEGSVAPLRAILERSTRYGAILVIDDSHGLGVLGHRGHGGLEAARVGRFDGIYTASLGKALANAGGVVAGKRTVIEVLRYSCPGLIYSTALPPVVAAGVLAALDVIESDFPTLRETMWRNHREFLAGLKSAGFKASERPAPIVPLHAGSTAATIRLAKVLFQQGILSVPFVPPSVPEGRGTVRLIVGAKFDESAMSQLKTALALAGQSHAGG